MDDQILEEPCECGGQVIEQVYTARDGITYWRLYCRNNHGSIGFAVVCPTCTGLMIETKKKRESVFNDDEYTEYMCPICHHTQEVCTFDGEDGK